MFNMVLTLDTIDGNCLLLCMIANDPAVAMKVHDYRQYISRILATDDVNLDITCGP
jgi:hypothetical protein